MHISRIGHKARIILGTVGVLSLAATGTVVARSAPPSIGRGVDFAEQPCFRLFFSKVTNICAEPHNFEMPLVTDNSGSKTVSINAFTQDATANQICCEAVSTDEQGNFVTRSTRVCTNVSGFQTLTVTGAFVPTRGRLFAACTMNPGGTISSINWNQ